MMADYIQIQWTCSGLTEAKKMVQLLLSHKLIACGSLIPWVESYYVWEGKVERSQETKVLMKTRKEKFEEVKGFILQNGSYEVPEITAFAITSAHLPYLEWIDQSLGS